MGQKFIAIIVLVLVGAWYLMKDKEITDCVKSGGKWNRTDKVCIQKPAEPAELKSDKSE